MSKKFNLCKDCSGIVLKSIGIVIALIQALTMHTNWKWLTIALTCIAISSPDSFAIYKIATMLLANIKYKQSTCFDYFERCLCCAVTLTGIFITALAITSYALCSAGIVYCPNAVIWALIATATTTIPAIYMLSHCKYHDRFALYKARRLVESNNKEFKTNLENTTIAEPDNRTKYLIATNTFFIEVNNEISAINNYIDNGQHSESLQDHVTTCEEKSNTALMSTQALLNKLGGPAQGNRSATSKSNLATEIQQNHYRIMRCLYSIRAGFWEIVDIRVQTPHEEQPHANLNIQQPH